MERTIKFFLVCFVISVITVGSILAVVSYRAYQYFTEGSEEVEVSTFSIMQAVEKGQLDVIKQLVKEGANIRALNNYAVRRAAERGYLEVVKYLVEQGADIHAMDDYALIRAARNGHLDVVEYLKSLD